METCPYCNNQIAEDWDFCHYCNKPLIVNPVKSSNNQSPQINQGFDSYYQQVDEKMQEPLGFDPQMVKKIQELDNKIQYMQSIGESIGSLLLQKAGIYYQYGDLSASLKVLEMAKNHFFEDDDKSNLAIVNNEIGLIHQETGFSDEAIYHFKKSIELFKTIGNMHKLIPVYNNIANTHYILKDLEYSYEYYNKALKLAEREGLTLEEIKTSSNLVDVLFLLMNYDKIKRILDRNLDYFQQIGDISGVIITLTKMGKLNYELGPNYYELSSKRLNDALELINRLERNNILTIERKADLQWECYWYLGKLNVTWNNDKEAKNYLLNSLQAIKTSHNKESINEGDVLEELADLHEFRGEINDSIKYYKLSHDVYYRFGDDAKCAELKYKIAQIHLDLEGNESDAIIYFEEALEIFKELNYSKETATILHTLGDIYCNKGLINMAISSFDMAKIYYQAINDDYNLKLIAEKINSLIN